MSYIKELLFRTQERIDNPRGALDDIAEALGGEVAGPTKVLAPSPGCGADDRSMVVFFSNPAQPERFYIYMCEGEMWKAKAAVREKLALVEPTIADAAERTAAAMRIWRDSNPAAGTIVETYLRSRAITVPAPDRLRFHPALAHKPTGSAWPAMVALVTDVNDVPRAIHRTWLRWDGSGKAPVDPDKMSIGPLRGCAVRLSPVAEQLCVGEGIETCMSAMMAGRPAWSAISAVGLRDLALPAEVRDVTILVDGDAAGSMAAHEAGGRWLREGRRVVLCRAPHGMDFNDLLMRQS